MVACEWQHLDEGTTVKPKKAFLPSFQPKTFPTVAVIIPTGTVIIATVVAKFRAGVVFWVDTVVVGGVAGSSFPFCREREREGGSRGRGAAEVLSPLPPCAALSFADEGRERAGETTATVPPNAVPP